MGTTYLVGRERRRAEQPVQREQRGTGPGRGRVYVGLAHPTVSRRHAELAVEDDRIVLRDIGSRNGTFLLRGGRKVRVDERVVEPGQLVFFGDCLRRVGSLLSERPRRNGPG